MSEEFAGAIQAKYAKLIEQKVSNSEKNTNCCASQVTSNLYQQSDLDGLSEDLIALSLGCGNPTALGSLYAGEIVLDLGSGAGLDVLLSAKRVGPTGKAYGLDMTEEMLSIARENQRKSGLKNVEFLKGRIEAIPLNDESIDVIVSNCVINLSGNKAKVMEEMARVLKPGGRIAVSDIVIRKTIPPEIQEKTLAWAGCLARALREDEYRTKLALVGMEDVEIVVTKEYDFADLNKGKEKVVLSSKELEIAKGSLVSAFIRAKKPARLLREEGDFKIRQANARDYSAIEALLTASDLPVVGVEKHIKDFLVAEQDQIIGVMGFLQDGKKSLIRSFAVAVPFRKAGIGRTLLTAMLTKLKQQEIAEVYLLTETAKDYFNRAGFSDIVREEMPMDLLQESGLDQACPCSSSCLKKRL